MRWGRVAGHRPHATSWRRNGAVSIPFLHRSPAGDPGPHAWVLAAAEAIRPPEGPAGFAPEIRMAEADEGRGAVVGEGGLLSDPGPLPGPPTSDIPALRRGLTFHAPLASCPWPSWWRLNSPTLWLPPGDRAVKGGRVLGALRASSRPTSPSSGIPRSLPGTSPGDAQRWAPGGSLSMTGRSPGADVWPGGGRWPPADPGGGGSSLRPWTPFRTAEAEGLNHTRAPAPGPEMGAREVTVVSDFRLA